MGMVRPGVPSLVAYSIRAWWGDVWPCIGLAWWCDVSMIIGVTPT